MQRHAIRLTAVLLAGAALAATPAVAQTQTGNRANGFDYQPTPGEVTSRERAAGVQPPVQQQQRTDHDLETIDRQLLQSHGLGTSSVPKIGTAR